MKNIFVKVQNFDKDDFLPDKSQYNLTSPGRSENPYKPGFGL